MKALLSILLIAASLAAQSAWAAPDAERAAQTFAKPQCPSHLTTANDLVRIADPADRARVALMVERARESYDERRSGQNCERYLADAARLAFSRAG